MRHLSKIHCTVFAIVLASLTAACSDSGSTGTTTTKTATSLTVATGNNQSVATGAVATAPLGITVLDQTGAAMTGVSVTWSVVSGGGTLSTTTSATNASGVATTTYTAGTTAGTAIVSASVSGLTAINFTITVSGGGTTTTCESQTTQTGKVVCLANVFLATLSTTQQAAMQVALTAANAVKWSNLPVNTGSRNGLQLGTLTTAQQTAALALVQAATSTDGYVSFQSIRAADEFLGSRAGGYGSGIYLVAILGTPSTTTPWMLQFGGHHYAGNVTFTGGSVAASFTPNFVGVEPQAFTLNGTSYAPMQTRRNAMYTMINSLDATQRIAAQLTTNFDDVLMGPNRQSPFPTQQGVLVSALSTTQQGLVTAAINAWVKDAPTELSTTLMNDYVNSAAYAATRIAWSRSTDSTTAGAYWRIDGPKVWIEFANQNGIVLQGIHFHTIWRDKTRDYGGQFTF